MKLLRPLVLVAPWIALALVGIQTTGDLTALLHVPTLLMVVAAPMLVAALAHTPRAFGHALGDVFSAEARDLPAERRFRSVAVLRTLGGASLAMGVLTVLLGTIALFGAVAASGGGQVEASLVAGGVGGLMIGPFYGVAVRVFLWDPLANSLEGAGEDLGSELVA